MNTRLCFAIGAIAFCSFAAVPALHAIKEKSSAFSEDKQPEQVVWARDSYIGPGGGLYIGPGGGLYIGPGGGSSTEPGGGLADGPGGGLYTGPGGGLSSGPGGGLYTGPGGGLSSAPGGGLYTGPGGGLYIGPGGGLYIGASDHPYHSNQPPRDVFLKYLKDHGDEEHYKLLKGAWNL